MNRRAYIVAIIALVGAVVCGTITLRSPLDTSAVPIATAVYQCEGVRQITAVFYTESVTVSLSDGRIMTLPQSRSASGARYTNFDESFVFWEKGNGALVLENDREGAFTGCTTP